MLIKPTSNFRGIEQVAFTIQDDKLSVVPDKLSAGHGLNLKEFSDSSCLELRLLHSVYLSGSGRDRVVTNEGFTADDIDYFIAEGILELAATADKSAPTEVTIHTTKIPDARLAIALQPEGGEEMTSETLPERFSAVFGFDALDEIHVLSLNEIISVVTNLDVERTPAAELKQATFSAADVVAAMSKLKIDPREFLMKTTGQ